MTMDEDRSIHELSGNMPDQAGTAVPEKRRAPTISELRTRIVKDREDRNSRKVDEILAPVKERIRQRMLDGTWEELYGAMLCTADDMHDEKLKDLAGQLNDLLDWSVLARSMKVRCDLDKVDVSEVLDKLVMHGVIECIQWDPELQMRLNPYRRPRLCTV